MERITRLAELNRTELLRIRRTLLQRFKVTRDSNIAEIGFGVAEKSKELDEQRCDSVIFYVRKKRRVNQSDAARIPVAIQVRVLRDGRYISVELPTDVVQFALRARLTGRRIYYRGKSQNGGTAGCVVVWRNASMRVFRWGVLTVSHIMPHRLELPEAEYQVLLHGQRRQWGRLIAVSRGTGLDAALVEFSRPQLEENGIIPVGQTVQPLRIRQRAVIAREPNARGHTWMHDEIRPITVQAFMPEFTLLRDEIGVLRDVVQVVSQRGSFTNGTSGTLWTIENQIACLQFGQINGSSHGLGQPLENIVRWAITALADATAVAVSEIEFRIVAII